MTQSALPALVEDIDATRTPLTPVGLARAMFVVAMMTCLTFALIVASELPISSPRIWRVTAIVAVCTIPIVTFAARPERWYPLLPLIGLAYLVGFGIPSFNAHLVPLAWVDPLLESDYEYASLMVLLGCSTLVAGMLAPMHRLISSRRWKWPADDKLVAARFGVAALVGSLFRILLEGAVVPEAMAQPVLVLSYLTEIGTFVVVALWIRKRGSALWCFVALAGLLPVLAVAFGSGKLWNVVNPVMTLGVAYYGFKRRIPWVPLLLVAAVFVPANLVKVEYRAQLDEYSTPILERPFLFGRVIWERYFHYNQTLEAAGGSVTDRMDHLSLMAQVVSMTPARIPYWNGETYMTLLYSPIPRFVMPDKPRRGLGQDFGHRYQFIGDEDYGTSVNLAQLVETYANFGPAGVGIGMFLIGLLYNAVAALFQQRAPPISTIAVSAVIAIHLFQIESDFSLINSGLLWEVPALWFAIHALCWKVSNPVATQG